MSDLGKNEKKDTSSINGKEKLKEYIDGQTDELGNLPAAAAWGACCAAWFSATGAFAGGAC